MGMMKIRRHDKQIVMVLALIVVILGLVLIPKFGDSIVGAKNTNETSETTETIYMPSVPEGTNSGLVTEEQTTNIVAEGNILEVSFIDVGEGDCIYISTSAGTNMLIDAGYGENADRVIPFLSEKEVTKIDYVVATHPHLDHIGALPDVIGAFTIGEVWMPTIPDDYQPTTSGYVSFLTAIAENQIPVKSPKEGEVLVNQDGLVITSLTPDNLPNGSMDETDLNTYSIVLRVDFGTTSFLLTGDAPATVEAEINAHGSNLDVDVIKISHHGSSDANDPGTLNVVSPKCAIICVGENEYGHPHEVVLERIEARGIALYRTDKNGTITFTSDGTNLSVSQ